MKIPAAEEEPRVWTEWIDCGVGRRDTRLCEGDNARTGKGAWWALRPGSARAEKGGLRRGGGGGLIRPAKFLRANCAFEELKIHKTTSCPSSHRRKSGVEGKNAGRKRVRKRSTPGNFVE